MSPIAKLFGRRSKSGTIRRTLPAALSLFEPLEERVLLASNPLYEMDFDGRSVTGTTDLGASDYTFQIVCAGDEAVDLSSLDGKDVQVTGPNGFSQLAKLTAVNGDPANIAIPSLRQWERDMLSYGAIHGDTSKVYNTWEGFPWYYDGEWAFYQIADYTGNDSWNASADHIEETYRTYVLANNGRVPGYRIFPHGLYEDFLRTGDEESKRAVLLLAKNAAFANTGGGALFTRSRETAYVMQAYMYAEKLGAPNPLLPVALEFALGHMDQWFVSKTATEVQPFMVGLTAHALIEYDQMYGDARIQPLLEKAADWLWENAWVENGQSFYYSSASPYDPTAKPTAGVPDLNMLIAPMYAWLFKQTGDMKYLERGDAVFAGGVKGAWLGGGKQFVQNYRLSFSYVQWRQAAQSERAASEQEISDLPASDGGATPTLTYRITTPGGSWDPTDNGTYTVSLLANQVTDAHGNYFPSGSLGTFDVAVAEPVPLFTSSETPSGAENTTAVVTLAATNADRPERTVTFSITGGTDQGLFQINSGNQLVFTTTPDYEAPADADHDNAYLVQVTADDGNGGTTVQSLSVTVTPVNDNNPVFQSCAAPNVAENTTAAVPLVATDADLPAQTVTFSITGGPDQSLVQIDGGNQLVFKSAPDYEAPADADHNNVYLVQVTADDGNGWTTVQDLNLTVTNVNEAPTGLSLAGSSVTENEPSGTAVETFSTVDGDLPGAPFTYSLVSGTGDTDNGSFTISGNALQTAAVFDHETKNSYSVRVRTTDAGGLCFEEVFTIDVADVQDATIAGRHIFYNNSYFDGNNAAANASDDNAIDPTKQALLPGQKATFANYTGYSRGINGIMVDVAGLANPSGLTAADFAFKVGNTTDPSTWAAGPAPQSITVRPGAGSGGSDRVTIIWADNAIEKKWLQVTVKATANTALASDDLFYFGNAVGESGDSVANAIVNSVDKVGARLNSHTPSNRATVSDVYDFNKDSLVNSSDLVVPRSNTTKPLTALNLITVLTQSEQVSNTTVDNDALSVADKRALKAAEGNARKLTQHKVRLVSLPLVP